MSPIGSLRLVTPAGYEGGRSSPSQNIPPHLSAPGWRVSCWVAGQLLGRGLAAGSWVSCWVPGQLLGGGLAPGCRGHDTVLLFPRAMTPCLYALFRSRVHREVGHFGPTTRRRGARSGLRALSVALLTRPFAAARWQAASQPCCAGGRARVRSGRRSSHTSAKLRPPHASFGDLPMRSPIGALPGHRAWGQGPDGGAGADCVPDGAFGDGAAVTGRRTVVVAIGVDTPGPQFGPTT